MGLARTRRATLTRAMSTALAGTMIGIYSYARTAVAACNPYPAGDRHTATGPKEMNMKPIAQMTADEMVAAKADGATVYGARLGKRNPDTGRVIYSDVEDFSHEALQETIANMTQRGWRLTDA